MGIESLNYKSIWYDLAYLSLYFSCIIMRSSPPHTQEFVIY